MINNALPFIVTPLVSIRGAKIRCLFYISKFFLHFFKKLSKIDSLLRLLINIFYCFMYLLRFLKVYFRVIFHFASNLAERRYTLPQFEQKQRCFWLKYYSRDDKKVKNHLKMYAQKCF